MPVIQEPVEKPSVFDRVQVALAAVLFIALAAAAVGFCVQTVLVDLWSGLVIGGAFALVLLPFLFVIARLFKTHLARAGASPRVAPRRPAPESSPRITLTDRGEATLRCGYCREDLDDSPVMLCGCCEARLHPECWSQLGGCPSLGCASARPSKRGAARSKAR